MCQLVRRLGQDRLEFTSGTFTDQVEFPVKFAVLLKPPTLDVPPLELDLPLQFDVPQECQTLDCCWLGVPLKFDVPLKFAAPLEW